VAAFAAASGTGFAAPLVTQDAAPLLPDLDPAAPGGARAVAATDGSGKIFLTFAVEIDNNGAGPLIVRGHRASTAEPNMTADQVVRLADGTTTTLPGVGSLVYYPLYARWGYTPYQTYELHQALDYALVGTGPDLNFCLEDNANPYPVLPGEPLYKVYAGCGKSRPTLLSLDVGISVGWANKHAAGKTGQMIDITSLPSGRYVLVHLVDPAGRLTESSDANNVSSTLLQVTWTTGVTLPAVKILRRCPSTPTC
jgi:Lysyl oxidase